MWFSPYNLVLSFLIVGTGVLDVPFMKISLCFARTTDGRPYRRCVVLSLLIVGDGVLDVPFVWRNVTFGSLREGAPAQAGGGACETRDGALNLK